VVTGSLDTTAIVWRSDKLISMDDGEKMMDYLLYLQTSTERFRENFSIV